VAGVGPPRTPPPARVRATSTTTTTEPSRKPSPARPAGPRCAPRVRSLRSLILRCLRRPGGVDRAAPFSPALLLIRPGVRAWWFRASRVAPHLPARAPGVFRPLATRAREPPRRRRERASWSRNRPADQPPPGRERVAEASRRSPRDLGKGRGAVPVTRSAFLVDSKGERSRPLPDDASTAARAKRARGAQRGPESREREGFAEQSIVATGEHTHGRRFREPSRPPVARKDRYVPPTNRRA
jgi:hypothetical protein